MAKNPSRPIGIWQGNGKEPVFGWIITQEASDEGPAEAMVTAETADSSHLLPFVRRPIGISQGNNKEPVYGWIITQEYNVDAEERSETVGHTHEDIATFWSVRKTKDSDNDAPH